MHNTLAHELLKTFPPADAGLFPFYPSVPKTLEANLRFRLELLHLAEHGDGDDMPPELARRRIYSMCARDLLFYVNAFVYVLNPREPSCPIGPFITYPFQDDAFEQLVRVNFRENVVIPKSRDMGGTWITITFFEWNWHFQSNLSFLVVSRKAELVDKKGDPSALLPKIDFIHRHLPGWLVPNVNRNHMHCENLDNNSLIRGEATVNEIAKGTRHTAILLDEYAAVMPAMAERANASSADATECRIFCSTYHPTGFAFERKALSTDLRQISLYWPYHPRKAPGLYQSTPDGALEILDKSYPFPQDYPFVKDGRLRSIAFDKRARELGSLVLIDMEWGMNPRAARSTVFDPDMLARIELENGADPTRKGDLEHDAAGKPVQFIDRGNGALRLWFTPEKDESGLDIPPSDSDYIIGIDTAQGKGAVEAGPGASNSVASIVARQTGRKVAELATCSMPPHEFATYCVALGNWFAGPRGKAFLIWEVGGPGSVMGDAIVHKLKYRSIFYRVDESSLKRKATDKPGFSNKGEARRLLYMDYHRALAAGEFINPSREAVQECREMIFAPDGTIEHQKALESIDPSGARENHGDRCTADALACRAMRDKPKIPDKPKETEPEEWSFDWRYRRHTAALTSEKRW